VTTTERIKSQLGKLPAADILSIEAFVADLVQRQALDVALERRCQSLTACVHCGLTDPMRWGRSKCGTQRFKCRDCKATFGATNDTPFFRLRNRHLWTRYLGLMRRHVSLKDLREHHGLNLSIPTLHRWRHRFLAALNGNPAGGKLAGLIEADEKFFRTSYKGSRGFGRGQPPQERKPRRRSVAGQRGLGTEQVPVLTALDRSGTIMQDQLPDMKWSTIAGQMTPWVERESVICPDGNGAYALLAQRTGCEHMLAKKGTHNSRGLSIGRIDAYHRDVANLINRRCNGVSTRYLMNYFGWARRITQHKPFGNDLLAEMLTP
jgi:transposase-like protein